MIEEVEKEETLMGNYDESFLIREDNKGAVYIDSQTEESTIRFVKKQALYEEEESMNVLNALVSVQALVRGFLARRRCQRISEDAQKNFSD